MKKLLAIDVGNTNVKYGLFLDGSLNQTWKHATKDTETACTEFLGKTDAPCAISSVVPAQTGFIKEAAGKRFLFSVSAGEQKILGGMAADMGADRVADAVAAYGIYGKGKLPTVVMSFGTASTLLAITGGGFVAGGWIMSGLTAQLEVMHDRCALLPRLAMEGQSLALGYDTETHMRNGVFVGNIGAAREWLRVAKKQLNARRVVSVATGGWAESLQEHGRIFDQVDPELTLKGIYLMAEAGGV